VFSSEDETRFKLVFILSMQGIFDICLSVINSTINQLDLICNVIMPVLIIIVIDHICTNLKFFDYKILLFKSLCFVLYFLVI